MARTTKKKEPAPKAQENNTALREGEAHLDSGQLAEMDEANLQGLAQDMGLDPAAYADRDALIAAIAAVPVIPGPPEPETQEAAQTAPEAKGDAQDAQAQEGQQTAPEGQGEGKGDAPETFTPYRATVAAPLVVIRRGTAPRPEDKPIGTLGLGDRVTVTGILDGYAILDNGTYIKADYLAKEDPEN